MTGREPETEQTLGKTHTQHKAENIVHELVGLGVDVDTINAEGACALHFACYSTGEGDSYCPAIARALLNAGATAEVVDASYGCTPLHWAASKGDQSLCHSLMTSGARVDTQVRPEFFRYCIPNEYSERIFRTNSPNE